MCYKIATPKKDKLVEHLKKFPGYEVKDYEMFYHADGFARPHLPVELNTAQKLIQPAMWGLIPSWVKTFNDAKKYANTLNGVGEELFEKPSYKPYVKKYRALLWIDGFYESYHPSPKVAEPHFIYAHNNEPFTLGCVWAPWQDQETKQWVNTFTIVTTPANELMSQIHNEKKRMPLIIPEENRNEWLNAADIDGIQQLIHTLPDGYLQHHQVSKLVNQRKLPNNVPEVQACI